MNFQRMASYLRWDEEDRFHNLCGSVEGVAGQVLWVIGPQATTADIVCLLQTRFRTQLQTEQFKAELHARRRAPGESLHLRLLYQHICKLVTLAYPSAEALLVTHVGKEAFIAVLSDGKLQLEVMKQELQIVEATLSYTIKSEAFEQSLTPQSAMADHNDGHAACWLCSVSMVAGPSEAGETAILCKLIRDLQNALAQATKVMAAMANGLWSDHTISPETASSVDSVPDTVLTPPALAPGHTSLGQPSREGGCGCANHQQAWKSDSCHVCGQVGQQTDKSNQQMEPANGTVTC